MEVKLAISVKNEALIKAFKTDGTLGKVYIGAGVDKTNFEEWAEAEFEYKRDGTVGIKNIARIPIELGKSVSILRIYPKREQNYFLEDQIAHINLEGDEIGDFTLQAGIYQINTLEITIV